MYASYSAKLLDHVGLEIRSLITVESFREPVMYNEIVPQTLRHSSGLLVGRWYGNRELRKVICDDKDVFCSTTVGFQRKEIHAK